MATLPDAISTDENPKIKEAVASPEEKERIIAFGKEFDSFTENET